MKEEQNKIMSRVIDYIMVTTNKYDYESIRDIVILGVLLMSKGPHD